MLASLVWQLLAGAEGFEPPKPVLETGGLPLSLRPSSTPSGLSRRDFPHPGRPHHSHRQAHRTGFECAVSPVTRLHDRFPAIETAYLPILSHNYFPRILLPRRHLAPGLPAGLLHFAVYRVVPARSAKLFQLQPSRSLFLILGSRVVACGWRR